MKQQPKGMMRGRMHMTIKRDDYNKDDINIDNNDDTADNNNDEEYDADESLFLALYHTHHVLSSA